MNVSKAICYKCPPVIERILGAYVKIDTETLVRNMDQWRDIVRKDFPVEKAETEWILHTKEKDGVPIPDPMVRIYYRHWHHDSDNQPVYCLQSHHKGFSVHIRRESSSKIHSYDELFELFCKWLPKWSECFNVPLYDGSILHYVNELSEQITPQFMGDVKNVKIGEALQVFTHFGGRFSSIVHPYNCIGTMKVSGHPHLQLTLQTRSILQKESDRPVVHVELLVRNMLIGQDKEPKKKGLQIILDECTGMHDVLIEGFSSFFTANALESFGPS